MNYRDQISVALRRLYVVVYTSHTLDGAYARLLAASLNSELSAHVEAIQAEIGTDMELDPNALPDRMERFRADGILVLRPTDVTLDADELGIDSPDRYRTLAGSVRYAAVLFDAKSREAVWRAQVLHEGYPRRVQERSLLAAREIVKALREDHLVK